MAISAAKQFCKTASIGVAQFDHDLGLESDWIDTSSLPPMNIHSRRTVARVTNLFVINFCVLLLGACATRQDVAVAVESAPTPMPSPVSAENPSQDYFAHLSKEHREIVETWLKSQPVLRPASEEADSGLMPGNDSRFPEGNINFLRETVGPNGNQYYATGDMNQDGQNDFAVLFVDTSNAAPDEFALAIFNGPFRPNAEPAYLEKDLHGISNCYIVFDRMSKGHLFLGKFESDAYCTTYYRVGKTYRPKGCL